MRLGNKMHTRQPFYKGTKTLLLSIIIILLGGWVVFFYYIKIQNEKEKNSVFTHSQLKIASINIERLEKKYLYFIAIERYIQKLTQKKDEELLHHLQSYQRKIALLEERHENLSFKEATLINQALSEMENIYTHLKTSTENQIADKKKELFGKAQKEIKKYIQDYNETANFDYILSDDKNILYIKNNRYDITNEILKGLNDNYKENPLLIGLEE